jgi:hypothetical protein
VKKIMDTKPVQKLSAVRAYLLGSFDSRKLATELLSKGRELAFLSNLIIDLMIFRRLHAVAVISSQSALPVTLKAKVARIDS